MITYVNKSNTAAYSFLYSEVSELLRTHDSYGNVVEYGSPYAVKSFEPMFKEVKGGAETIEEKTYTKVELAEATYKPGKFYIKLDDGSYARSEVDTFDEGKDYFEQTIVNYIDAFEDGVAYFSKVGNEYHKINITEDMEPELNQVYFMSLMTATNYQPGRYYIANDEGKYVLAESPDFDPEVAYFNSDTITSLDELFAYIKDIQTIAPRYTRLPIDEDLFVIDTNTRVITIPPSFAKNGISVQGDEISEIIYFKVDRYYDATDLYLQNILIQWEIKDKDEEGKTITVNGVSTPWVIDIESEPGYIIFGWPLSSKITRAAGNVRFSVRFYKYDKDDIKQPIKYSLSTLTATAAIKEALNFNLAQILADGVQIDDSTGLISDRFENSPLLGDGTTAAEDPVFLADYSLPEFINLDLDSNGFRTVDVKIPVEAVVSDAGQLSYYWRKFDLDGYRAPIDYAITMVKTKDTKRITGKLYYVEDIRGGYTLLSNSINEFTGDDITFDIYERVSEAIINSVGMYYVIAANRVRNTTAETREPDGKFKYCTVPMPVTPTRKTDLPEYQILTQNDSLLKFTATLTDNCEITDAGKMTYQWYYSKTGEDGTFEPIDSEDATKDILVIMGQAETVVDETDEEGNIVSYKITGPVENAEGADGDGYYKIITTNNLNKNLDGSIAQKSQESSVCRVTHAATKMNITLPNANGRVNFSIHEVDAIGGLQIAYALPENSGERAMRTKDDKVTCTWYRYYEGTGNLRDDLIKADALEYRVNSDTLMPVSTTEGNVSIFFPSEPGYYFCEVDNEYNHTHAKRCSRFFNIQEV